MDLKKLTARQTSNYYYMAEAMRRLEWDLHNHIEATGRIPREWHDIAKEKEAKARVRVTMRMDEDVLRFFRSMGAGHLARMNAVLRTYMHARLAGVLKGAETSDFYRRQQDYHDGPRPIWGEMAAEFEEGAKVAPEDKAAESMARVREELKRRGLE